MQTMEMSFSVEGKTITNIAREWFFVEHKEYEKSEELILACMEGSELTEEELKILARKIILGFASFTGNSRDNTFKYTDDVAMDIIPLITRLIKQYSDVKEKLENLEDKYDRLLDEIEEKELFDEFETLNPTAKKKKESLLSPMLESYIKASKYDDNYGWLEPNGEFHIVPWGEHQEWARDYILEHKVISDDEWMDYKGKDGDVLYNRGWVLLHNPGQGIGYVSKSKPLTKQQRDFLFGYYTDRGEDEEARKCFEEEI